MIGLLIGVYGVACYVVFFATAGAHLAIPLLRTLWPVALVLAGARAAITYVAGRVGSRFVWKRGRAAILELLRVGPHRRRPLRTSLVFLIRLALSASSLSKIDLSHIDFVLAAACA